MTEPVVRIAARVVVMDPEQSVLLQRVTTPDGLDFWITPGGALESGEEHADAACREAFEELGIEIAGLGAPIWTRRHVFPWGETTYDQREQYFLIRLDSRVEAAPTIDEDQLRAEGISEHRWWTIEEIEASDLEFAPRRLAELLRTLAIEGPPPAPIDVGI